MRRAFHFYELPLAANITIFVKAEILPNGTSIWKYLPHFINILQISPTISSDKAWWDNWKPPRKKKKEEKGMICDYGSGKVCSDMAAKPTRNGNVLGRM